HHRAGEGGYPHCADHVGSTRREDGGLEPHHLGSRHRSRRRRCQFIARARKGSATEASASGAGGVADEQRSIQRITVVSASKFTELCRIPIVNRYPLLTVSCAPAGCLLWRNDQFNYPLGNHLIFKFLFLLVLSADLQAFASIFLFEYYHISNAII